MMEKKELFRSIPKVDMLLEKKRITEMVSQYGRDQVINAIRSVSDQLREEIRNGADPEAVSGKIADISIYVRNILEDHNSGNMKSVINATGTILHTNLGRAPISKNHAERLIDVITGYSNLEYDLKEGKRGERYDHFAGLLCELTGAEAAMAVNNNAGSVLLALSALAYGGEVIVSRGELIEIGGKFRIPDVCRISGAKPVEIGTTNKTRFSDYEEAINENTKAILKVHTSNYRIIGFTESVELKDLRHLADMHDIPLIEDLGSGVLVNLQKYGLSPEPKVQEALENGADVVCFSGDKLLGGPQAGIIVGKKKYIDRLKKDPLTRALRIDKFTAAALEMVLMEYLNEENAVKNIPVLKMIGEQEDSLQRRARELKNMLEKAEVKAEFSVEECESQIGGGAFPEEYLKSRAISVAPTGMTAEKLERELRSAEIPVIARIYNGRVYFDLRTVSEEEYAVIAEEIGEICGKKN